MEMKGTLGFQVFQPLANEGLKVDFAGSFYEKAPAMAASNDVNGGLGRAKNNDRFACGRGRCNLADEALGFGGVGS